MGMNTSVFRLITAGSVDDGKSTLIGRLLYDSKALLGDQLEKINQAHRSGEQPDFAALTDGLAAEKEQGITIDVAYRYFSTSKRKFIIADTPGHEQYTRNMVTGASTADAAVILIDATRVELDQHGRVQLLAQTKRHSAILKLMGTPYIIVAINKLDLLDFDESIYQSIVQSYQTLAEQLGLRSDIHFIPMSALSGDNIVEHSQRTPWYHGLALLPLLESLPTIENHARNLPAHFPVQRIVRQDGSRIDDFRGYQGRLESGCLRTGDAVRVLPSGQTAHIENIYRTNQSVDMANSGEVLTITLNRDVDVSRGDAIVSDNNLLQSRKNIQAALCWFDNAPLNMTRRYVLKNNTQTTAAKITMLRYSWDVHTLSRVQAAETLNMNDIGMVNLVVQQPIHATSYTENPTTGSFILIDASTHHTVAAGMIMEDAEIDDFEI